MSAVFDLKRQRSWQSDGTETYSRLSSPCMEYPLPPPLRRKDLGGSLMESETLRKLMVFPSDHHRRLWRETSSECDTSTSDETDTSRSGTPHNSPHEPCITDEDTTCSRTDESLPCSGKRYPCPWEGCTVTQINPSGVRRHVAKVHSEKRNFKCDICGKQLKYKFNLKTHMIIHTGEFPFMCRAGGCLLRFNDGSKRRLHERREHPEQELAFRR